MQSMKMDTESRLSLSLLSWFLKY